MVSKQINSKVILNYSEKYDLNVVLIKLNGKNLVAVNVYIPPVSKYEIYHDFLKKFNEIYSKYCNSIFIIMGDFNLPKCYFNIDSDNKLILQCLNKNHIISENAYYLYANIKAFKMLQFNKYLNANNNILDLVFSTHAIKVQKPTTSLVKVDISHEPLEIKLNLNSNLEEKNEIKVRYNFKKANWQNIFISLSKIDWTEKLSTADINLALSQFYEVLYHTVENNIPKVKYTTDNYPSFFSLNLKRSIKIKKIYHRNYKKARNRYNYSKFNRQRRLCKSLYQIDYKKNIAKIENDLKLDQKPFWQYINKANNINIPNEMIYNDLNLNNELDIANAFSSFFQDVYKVKKVNKNIKIINNNNNILNIINISEKDVENAIDKLKSKHSPGPDSIHAIYIKNCTNYLFKPLHIIFNLSIKLGIVPDKWKKAFVKPIFKSRDLNNIKNYRPIAITNSFAKMLDGIIYNKLVISFKKIIIKLQHGSIP